MTSAGSASRSHSDLGIPGREPYDSFVVATGTAVLVLFAIAGVPALAGPTKPPLALAIVVALVAGLCTLQWLATQRRFGFTPPLIPAVVGVMAIIIVAPYHGEAGALTTLALTVIAVFSWRIVETSPTRYADVAYGVAAAAIIGYLPAQLLLLRLLPDGATVFYVVLACLFAANVALGMLSAPARDGTRSLDLASAVAVGVSFMFGAILGLIFNPPFGFGYGVLAGVAVGIGVAAGRAMLAVLTPTPVDGDRVVRRRPLLLDSFLPIATGSAAAYVALRLAFTV